ncbi:hypothetical protein F2Q70_00013614 [Brassica cretica]|uniref:tRNA-dihydrouridine(47) synthase [NAD(P)(+)] n=1 Tax=Brassica cretica TaxID=69181 RepID=A0A8S9LT33_BRACR|nr:hypothetical protein F2Q70_00013614 [Brassica cretica]
MWKVKRKKNGRSTSKATKIEDEDSIKVVETDGSLKSHPREKKKLIDFRDKLYLAPLTTVGNLPFRRLCKVLGADVTCGEMAMCTNLLQGQASEWALFRRHSSEDLFGVQICGSFPDTVARAVELIDRECIDINMGCPIDMVVNKSAGSAILNKPLRMKNIVEVSSSSVETPITIKSDCPELSSCMIARGALIKVDVAAVSVRVEGDDSYGTAVSGSC